MIVCNNNDDDFKVNGVFHVAGGKEGVAWTDQVENDDDGCSAKVMDECNKCE